MRMRIIAGKYGGQTFDSPDSAATHPMGERMRGALFNILGDISGQTLLDPFAGSGAISFEAVSRGVTSSIALDSDRLAQRILHKNIGALRLGNKITLVKANCRMWSQQNPDVKFDLIIADPPYHDMQLSTVSLLVSHLKPNGLMVLSYPGRGSAPTVNGVVVVDNRLYGDAALAFYRPKQSS